MTTAHVGIEADIMGTDNLYYQRGNALDIRGGCALDGLPVPCSLVNEAIASETGSVAFEYQLNDGTVIPEQGRITHIGAGLYTFDYPILEFDRPEDGMYRVGWRGGSFYLPLQDATSDQQSRFDAAKADLMSRLGENNGKNKCADLFGGYDKAMKALNETKFSFVSLAGPLSDTRTEVVHAGTKGRNVYINSSGGFMAVNGHVPTVISSLPNTDRPNQRAFVTRAEIPGGEFVEFRNDVKFGSFVLLHELGHRRKIYGKHDNDARDDKNGTRLEKTARNNKRVLDACFGND